jgi:hypothetical protein
MMLERGEARAFIDVGKKNLAANRACVARARRVLDDARIRLGRYRSVQASRCRCESPLVISEVTERCNGFASPRVYACPKCAPDCRPVSDWVVPSFTADIIAEAYEVGHSEQVQIDARVLREWPLPLDNFATCLGMRHGWTAGTAVVYLGALRSALLDRHSPTPWDDC